MLATVNTNISLVYGILAADRVLKYSKSQNMRTIRAFRGFIWFGNVNLTHICHSHVTYDFPNASEATLRDIGQ